MTVLAIKCYQCSTENDAKGSDNCGAYASFDKNQNIAVDCMGEEAVSPGEMNECFNLFYSLLTPLTQLTRHILFQVNSTRTAWLHLGW